MNPPDNAPYPVAAPTPCWAPDCTERPVVMISLLGFCTPHGLDVVDALDVPDGPPPKWWPS